MQNIMESLKANPVTLISKEMKTALEVIRTEVAPEGKLAVCDTNIKGFELETPITGGFSKDDVINIDHHFPTLEYSRQISSTNLAIEYVKEYGPVSPSYTVVINHTDCDSILSSGILRGILEPKSEYGVAAIAADHTGEDNEIGDLLQALGRANDIELSFRNLDLFLNSQPLEKEAEKLLEKRREERRIAAEVVKDGFTFTADGKIAYAQSDRKVDSGLFPALMPEAEVIIFFCPMRDKESGQVVPGKMEAKVRLGASAPEGTDLRKLMATVDESFGGRWNAGSNGRNGGTELSLAEYAAKVSAAYLA